MRFWKVLSQEKINAMIITISEERMGFSLWNPFRERGWRQRESWDQKENIIIMVKWPLNPVSFFEIGSLMIFVNKIRPRYERTFVLPWTSVLCGFKNDKAFLNSLQLNISIRIYYWLYINEQIKCFFPSDVRETLDDSSWWLFPEITMYTKDVRVDALII